MRQGIDFQFADIDETIPDQSVEFGSVKDKEKSSCKAVEQTSRLVEAPQVLAIVSDSMEHIPHRLEDGNLSFHEVGMDLANQENPEETQRSISQEILNDYQLVKPPTIESVLVKSEQIDQKKQTINLSTRTKKV